jgi:hypothetical protein
LQHRYSQRFLRIDSKDSISALLNIIGRVCRHVSIFIHGHTHKRFDSLASGTLNVLLDVLCDMLLHDALVGISYAHQGHLFHTHSSRSCDQRFPRPNIPQRTRSFRARCQTTEWRGSIGHCEGLRLRAGYQTTTCDENDDKSGEVSGSESFAQLPGCLHGMRQVFEVQERNVLAGSLGATSASTEGDQEAQSCDGEHTCTSGSSRCGRSGWYLGV